MKIFVHSLAVAVALVALVSCSGKTENSSADYPEWEYSKIKASLIKGWNTWDTRNAFNQVWSEDKLGIKISLIDKAGNENDRLRIGNREDDAAIVHPYDHTYDGTYAEADASWHGIDIKMRSSAEGKRLVVLFTPSPEGSDGFIKVSPGKIWGPTRIEGSWNASEDHFEIVQMFGTGVMTGKVVSKDTRFVRTGSNGGYYLCPADSPVLIYTGEEISVNEAEELMASRKEAFEESEKAKWGEDYDVHHAMQSILAWDTIFDPADAVVVTPVSRNWNVGWVGTSNLLSGYVLFDWDTYFASEMLSVDNRELAYCNAIEITMATDKCGFVPNFTCSNDAISYDRSQPPVGSRAVWTIYERYGDKWFLELLYPRLLRWNLWWMDNRLKEGLLCWGSTPSNGGTFTDAKHARQQAIFESGLDNTCVYDDSEYLLDEHTTNYNDVGLSAMYVMDCKYLEKIALELGKRQEAKEIAARGKQMASAVQTLWSEEDGMFYCRNFRTGELVRKMDPTNFYPMLAGIATPKQAERMIKEHLLNEEEFWGEWVIPCSPRNDPAFKDNNYWRGRIWGPTNFLVYLGLREYDCPEVRSDLAEKSKRLLMKDWLERGYIYENWNSVTGEGDDVGNSDKFYHWGSLLGYITLMEKGL